jgi:hypothetical protein
MSRFDLFRIAGVRVNENQFSEALVALFDARASHGLGERAFRAFLSLLPVSAARRIQHDVRQRVRYSVRSQRSGEKTTPDILVLGDSFIVLIEHKVRWGRETVVEGKKQTVRQAKMLLELCERHHVKQSAALGVLLSPEGTRPSAPSFVTLRTGRLLNELRDLVQRKGKVDAFLEMWDEFNA